MTGLNTHLTRGRLLAGNAIWNLVGFGAPLIFGLLCIPVVVREMGADRFGVLTLAWAVVGYASFFDLGLGRALTKLVAEKLGSNRHTDIPIFFWTSLLLMTILGLIGAAAVIAISPWLVHEALKIPKPIQNEALWSFVLLGLSIPVILITAGFRGFLEAHQAFRTINLLRVPMGMLTFGGPLIVLPFSRSLSAVVAVLVLGRAMAAGAHLLMCVRVMPNLWRRAAFQRAVIPSLLQLGTWMTVSNIIGPLMLYSDRFLIGALLSVSAVAYYATPYEFVTRLLLFPSAIAGVVFPAFSATFTRDPTRTAIIFKRSLKYLAIVLFPAVLLVVTFAEPGLRVWLGAEFARNSARVLQYLAVGVFLNSLTLLAFTLLQAVGRPDITAKVHLIEVPGYLLLLWLLVRAYGIEGAAIAWTIRVAIDAAVMFGLAKKFLSPHISFSKQVALGSIMPCRRAAEHGLQGFLCSGYKLRFCTHSLVQGSLR
jgi:O-antigen/teichoic acid export membrane protein